LVHSLFRHRFILTKKEPFDEKKLPEGGKSARRLIERESQENVPGVGQKWRINSKTTFSVWNLGRKSGL